MVRVTDEVRRLRRRFQERGEETAIWEAVQLARHQDRPYTLDYAKRLFGDFYELHGKAIRVLELAARLGLPVLTLVDTPGAYPGVGAEQRGQAGMIARSIQA